MQKATPKQYYQENQLRAKYNLTKLKDPKAPRVPKNAFLIYLEHLRKTNDPALLKNVNVKDHAIAAGEKYRGLSTTEKKVSILFIIHHEESSSNSCYNQVYTDEAKRLMDQYKEKKAAYDALAQN